MERKFSQYEIYHIIDKKIEKEHELKTAYIQKNGYVHKDVLNLFDTRIFALLELYKEFDYNGTF